MHQSLVKAVEEAELVAAAVDIDRIRFQAARSAIREALRTEGIAEQIDELVLDLLTALASVA